MNIDKHVCISVAIYKPLSFWSPLHSAPFIQDVELLHWIRYSTNVTDNAVFAGNMAHMAMIYVGTPYSVTNHPQFETALAHNLTQHYPPDRKCS